MMYIDSATGLQVLEKQPVESRRFYFDLANLLEGTRVDTVVSVVATNMGQVDGSSDVTISEIAASPEGASFRIAGGTDGEHYKITVNFTTARGDTLQTEGMLYCTDS